MHGHPTHLAWMCSPKIVLLHFYSPESNPKVWFVLKVPIQPSTQHHIMRLTYLLCTSSSDSCNSILYLCNRCPSYSEQQADRLPSLCTLTDPTISLLTSISPKPRLQETNQPPTSSPHSLSPHSPFCSFFICTCLTPAHISLCSMSKIQFRPCDFSHL